MKKFWIILVAALWTLFLLPFAVYFGALFIAYGCNPDFLKIDSCIDAGGTWDYVNRVAVFEETPGINDKESNNRSNESVGNIGANRTEFSP